MCMQLEFEDFCFTKVKCELRRAKGKRTREHWWAYDAGRKKWLETHKDWLCEAKVLRKQGKTTKEVSLSFVLHSD